MGATATLRVEPSELEVTGKQIAKLADALGYALRELAGVQHAQNAADSPEVAAALLGMVDAWGTELANLTVFTSAMAEKLQSAGTSYLSTDTDAADWLHSLPGAEPPRPPADPR